MSSVIHIPDITDQVIHRWLKDFSLTDKLLGAIGDDKQIKQGLYPGPGANASTKRGGGLPKAEHHWQLVLLVFGDHADYQDSVARATGDPAQRKIWCQKIKNRLRS